MRPYVIRRIFLFIPNLLLASVVVFFVMRVMPGDVAMMIIGADNVGAAPAKQVEELRTNLGLNDSLPVQYGKWLWSMVNGRFGGDSLYQRRPIREIIAERLPATMQLAMYSLVIAFAIGVPLGAMAALRQDRWPDHVARVFTISGLALPHFWVGLIMILLLVLLLQWTPPVVYANLWDNPIEHAKLLIWPVLTLGWGYSAYVARITRSTMLEVLRSDYVRTARSKGLTQRVITYRHAFRNGMIPVVTLAGMHLGTLLSGAVIIETIFGIPGIGRQTIESVGVRDYPVVQTLVFMFTLIMLSMNLIVDTLYVLIDPRIKYS